MKDFIQKFINARKAIKQIREGEWVAVYNTIAQEHDEAVREDKSLCISRSWVCCDTREGHFGLLCGAYVWFAAARKLKESADAKLRTTPVL